MRKILGLLLLCAACGNSISANDLSKQFVAAVCQFRATCGVAPDVASCEAAVALDSTGFLTQIADSNSGKIKYDGGEAYACVNNIKNQTCNFTGFQTDPNDPCTKIFKGTVATGGACFVDAECASGGACTSTTTTCDQTTTCCTGTTCAMPPTIQQAGGTCMADGECAPGLYCSNPMANPTGTCKAAIATSGAACDSSFAACANPMYCDVFATSPTCKTAAAHGAACMPTDSLPCTDTRDFCDPTANKCVATLAVGATCDPNMSGQCVGYAACDATTMKCVAFPKIGETCTVDAMTGQSNCLFGNPCTNGKCTLPAAGMACK